MPNVYYGINSGSVVVSLSEEKVRSLIDYTFRYNYVRDTIHSNRVYMVRTYFGTCKESNGFKNKIYDYSPLFHSVVAAKKYIRWQEAVKLASRDGKNYVVGDRLIATIYNSEVFSDNTDTEDDSFLKGMINTQIITLSLLK